MYPNERTNTKWWTHWSSEQWLQLCRFVKGWAIDQDQIQTRRAAVLDRGRTAATRWKAVKEKRAYRNEESSLDVWKTWGSEIIKWWLKRKLEVTRNTNVQMKYIRKSWHQYKLNYCERDFKLRRVYFILKFRIICIKLAWENATIYIGYKK